MKKKMKLKNSNIFIFFSFFLFSTCWCLLEVEMQRDSTHYFAYVDSEKGKDNPNNFFSTSLEFAPTWKTLQFAMDTLTSSNTKNNSTFTIYLMSGIYSATSTITNTNLNLHSNSSRNESFEISSIDVYLKMSPSKMFFLNSLYSSFTLKGISFQEYQIDDSIIKISSSNNLKIEKCLVKKNVLNAPFLSTTKSNNITFSQVIFKDNQNKNEKTKGGIVLLDFTNNLVVFDSCIFSSNNADNINGGVFINQLNSNTTFINSSFLNNNSSMGSAVYLKQKNIDTSFYNCSFIANSAYDGGSVLIYNNNEKTLFSGCSFINNKASNDGGVMWVEKENSIRIENSVFKSNIAFNNGTF